MADVIYSTAAFRHEHEGEWQAFEALCNRLEGWAFRRISDEELLALPRLYRATLSSLSIARATSLDAALIDYLEGLATRGYFLIYGVRESRRARLAAFFRYDWPAAVKGLWRETLIVFAVLALGIALSWWLVASDANWYHALMPEGMVQGRGPDASVAELRATIFGTAPEDRAGLHFFATFLFTNNASVAINAFALGFAFGVPTLLLIFYQGLSTGPMLFVFAKAGLLTDFVGWLSIHGTTEIFAIIIAGAAGLRIGTGFAFPGARSRMEAAAQAGRDSGAAMIGVLLMLALAGLLEGFARQLVQQTALRYAIGGALLLFWCSYFYLPRRRSGVGVGTK
ncbi:MAG: stage II sporulation protein M [Sphingomonadaceae bacterium]|nr:stage II sporulation protein M [Sphingomonadaceae bacterium]